MPGPHRLCTTERGAFDCESGKQQLMVSRVDVYFVDHYL